MPKYTVSTNPIQLESGVDFGQFDDLKNRIDDACDNLNFQQVPEDQVWRISLAK